MSSSTRSCGDGGTTTSVPTSGSSSTSSTVGWCVACGRIGPSGGGVGDGYPCQTPRRGFLPSVLITRGRLRESGMRENCTYRLSGGRRPAPAGRASYEQGRVRSGQGEFARPKSGSGPCNTRGRFNAHDSFHRDHGESGNPGTHHAETWEVFILPRQSTSSMVKAVCGQRTARQEG